MDAASEEGLAAPNNRGVAILMSCPGSSFFSPPGMKRVVNARSIPNFAPMLAAISRSVLVPEPVPTYATDGNRGWGEVIIFSSPGASAGGNGIPSFGRFSAKNSDMPPGEEGITRMSHTCSSSSKTLPHLYSTRAGMLDCER